MGRLCGWSRLLAGRRARCRAVVVALAVVIAGGGTAGCDGGPPDPEPTPPPPSVDVSASGPTTSGAPVPPVAPAVPTLPAAAREASEEGARAFVGYYWELVNYAQATGDVRRLRRASGPKCEQCQRGISAIATVYANGGYITEANYTPTITRFGRLQGTATRVRAFEGTVRVTNGAHKQVAADGTEREFPPSELTYEIYLLWVNERWRLDVMETR